MSVARLPPPLKRSSTMTRLLADLRVEVAVEEGEAAGGRVGHVDVRHAPAGRLVHVAPVVLDPGEVPQRLLAGDRHHGHLARAVARRARADPEHDALADGPFEEAEDAVGGGQRAAVDGQQVLAGGDVDAGLRERRAQAAGSSSRRCRRARTGSARSRSRSRRRAGPSRRAGPRRGAAADAEMADGDLAEHLGEQVVQVAARRRRRRGTARTSSRPPPGRGRGSAGRRRTRAGCARPRGTSAATRPAGSTRTSMRVGGQRARRRRPGRRRRRRRARCRHRLQRGDEPAVALAVEHLLAVAGDLEARHAADAPRRTCAP